MSTPRYKERNQIINFVYKHILIEANNKKTRQFIEKKEFSEWQKNILINLLDNWDEYAEKISIRLKDTWSFFDISNLEKAILLIALSEFYSKATSKTIAINEAVKIAKKYSSGENYKYINAILDRAIEGIIEPKEK